MQTVTLNYRILRVQTYTPTHKHTYILYLIYTVCMCVHDSEKRSFKVRYSFLGSPGSQLLHVVIILHSLSGCWKSDKRHLDKDYAILKAWVLFDCACRVGVLSPYSNDGLVLRWVVWSMVHLAICPYISYFLLVPPVPTLPALPTIHPWNKQRKISMVYSRNKKQQ